MKFSKQLSAAADLRYLQAYIAYKDLKKAIKLFTGSDVEFCTVRDVVSNFRGSTALTGPIFRPPESRFQDLLNHELEKINSFSRKKVLEILEALADAYTRLQTLRSNSLQVACAVAPSSQASANTRRKASSSLLLQELQQSNSNKLSEERRPAAAAAAPLDEEADRGKKTVEKNTAESLLMMMPEEKEISHREKESVKLLEFGHQLLHLENVLNEQSNEVVFLDSYVRLNFTGFRKITKKYDKHNCSAAASWYMSRVVRQDFMNLNFSLLLARLASSYELCAALKGLLTQQQKEAFHYSLPVEDKRSSTSGCCLGSSKRSGDCSSNSSSSAAAAETFAETAHASGGKPAGFSEGLATSTAPKHKCALLRSEQVEAFFSAVDAQVEEANRSSSSRSTQLCCTKFLVPPDELMRVKVFILKRYPLLAVHGVAAAAFADVADSNNSSAQEAPADAFSKEKKKNRNAALLPAGSSTARVPTWHVYLDNTNFDYYVASKTEKMKRPMLLPRIRWLGQSSSVSSPLSHLALELCRIDECASSPQEDVTINLDSNEPGLCCSANTVILKRKELQELIRGSAFPEDILRRLSVELHAAEASGGADGLIEKTAADVAVQTEKSVADRKPATAVNSAAVDMDGRLAARTQQIRCVLETVFKAVNQQHVSPCLRVRFYRTQFRSKDGLLSINMDEDIRFSRELNKPTPPLQWIRSETDALATDDVHPFLWGVLNISLLLPLPTTHISHHQYHHKNTTTTTIATATIPATTTTNNRTTNDGSNNTVNSGGSGSRSCSSGSSESFYSGNRNNSQSCGRSSSSGGAGVSSTTGLTAVDGIGEMSDKLQEEVGEVVEKVRKKGHWRGLVEERERCSGHFGENEEEEAVRDLFFHKKHVAFIEFLSELSALPSVTEVEGFSLFVHGVAQLYMKQLQQMQQKMQQQSSEKVELLPHWLQYTTAEMEREIEEKEERLPLASVGNGPVKMEASIASFEEDSGGGDDVATTRRRGDERRRYYKGSLIDVVHKGTSASLVHEWQSSLENPERDSSAEGVNGEDEAAEDHQRAAAFLDPTALPQQQPRARDPVSSETAAAAVRKSAATTMSLNNQLPSAASLAECRSKRQSAAGAAGSAGSIVVVASPLLLEGPAAAQQCQQRLRQPLLLREEDEEAATTQEAAVAALTTEQLQLQQQQQEQTQQQQLGRRSRVGGPKVAWWRLSRLCCGCHKWLLRTCSKGVRRCCFLPGTAAAGRSAAARSILQARHQEAASVHSVAADRANSSTSRKRGGFLSRLLSSSTRSGAVATVGGGGAAAAAAVRVEPKTFFANERTLLQWLNTAVLIATIAITLMNFGSPVGRVAGLVMSPVAVFFIGYSFWVYLRRAKALERKEPINYNDKLGPSILVVTLMSALSIVILLNILYGDDDMSLRTESPSPTAAEESDKNNSTAYNTPHLTKDSSLQHLYKPGNSIVTSAFDMEKTSFNHRPTASAFQSNEKWKAAFEAAATAGVDTHNMFESEKKIASLASPSISAQSVQSLIRRHPKYRSAAEAAAAAAGEAALAAAGVPRFYEEA